MRYLVLAILVFGVAVSAMPGRPDTPGVGKRKFDKHRIIGVTATTEAQLRVLKDLEVDSQLSLDFWKDPGLNRQAEIRVSPTDYGRFMSVVRRAGMTPQVLVEDVQGLLDHPPKAPARAAPYGFTEGKIAHNKYYKMSAIDAYLLGFEKDFSFVSYHVLSTKTYDRRNIPYLKITGLGSNKKTIFIEAGMHAREWISPASILYFIDRLMHRKDVDSDSGHMINNFDFYIVPVANPDGYEYSHTHDRMWRKNRNNRGCNNCRGVDLNRNFNARHGTTGISWNCCSDLYPGPNYFSEAETDGINVLVKSINQTATISAYISVHSYSQFLLTPWAYTRHEKPDDYNYILGITNGAQTVIRDIHGRNYEVGTPPELLYEASGGSYDWAKLTEGIKYAMTYELRPASASEGGFVLHESHIIPTGEEVFFSIYHIITNL